MKLQGRLSMFSLNQNHYNHCCPDRRLLLGFLMAALCPTLSFAQVYSFSTIAGQPGIAGTNDGLSTNALFYAPSHLGMDANGNLYICDRGNHTIRRMIPSGAGWIVSTIAGHAGHSGSSNGTGREAGFDEPSGVVADTNGNLYISDY